MVNEKGTVADGRLKFGVLRLLTFIENCSLTSVSLAQYYLNVL